MSQIVGFVEEKKFCHICGGFGIVITGDCGKVLCPECKGRCVLTVRLPVIDETTVEK